jgi:hypothetical protein
MPRRERSGCWCCSGLVGRWLRNWGWVIRKWGTLMQASESAHEGGSQLPEASHRQDPNRVASALSGSILIAIGPWPVDCWKDAAVLAHRRSPATVDKPRPVHTYPPTGRDMQMRLGQRVILSQTRGWTSVTCSSPCASFLRNRKYAKRPVLDPGTRASFGTSPLCASNMSSANRNAEVKSDAPRHNAWVGSAGAGGHDLRSELLCWPPNLDIRQLTMGRRHNDHSDGIHAGRHPVVHFTG